MRRLLILPYGRSEPARAGGPGVAGARSGDATRLDRGRRALTVGLLLAALFAVAPAWAKEGKVVKVSIKSLKYAPATVQVEPGDTVVWTNDDDRGHTVVSTEGTFRSGEIAAGKSFRHTFDEAGKFPYHCDHHPRMKGSVVVKAKQGE